MMLHQFFFNRVVAAVLLISLFSCPCWADVYHVSGDGLNSSSGSLEKPWKTIQHALSSVNAGDSIQVHAGTYHEFLSVKKSGNSTDGDIVLTNYADDKVVLDGSKAAKSDIPAVIEIRDQSYVTIRGLEICNVTTDTLNETPIGILVSGACSAITIVDCTIHHIASLATPNGSLSGRDAHGIAVYGDNRSPITNLKINSNTLYNLTLGSSEALVVNGNVDGFEIRDNVIHDCDNIGIDCIGFEKVSPDKKTDQARNGVVSGNLIFNIATAENPSYEGESAAAGIYVDGGRDIVIERNRVHHCDFGIEIASEKKGKITQGVSARNNVLHNNLLAGLIMGGYNKNSTGSAKNCSVTNNTFFNNDTNPNGDEWGQIHLQFRVENCSFSNNILFHDIAKDGNNLFIVHWNETGGGNTFNHNMFFGTATPVWVLGDKWIEGWSEYQSHAISGRNEMFADPMLVSPKSGDFSLEPESSCIDSGDASLVDPDQLDYLGQKRVHGKSVDRGAIESSKRATVDDQ